MADNVQVGDDALNNHHASVAELADRVCAALELAAAERQEIRVAAALHDLGKMAIPRAILDKPGPLSEQEWPIMQQHVVIGEQALAPALPRVAELVGATHERYAGGGYPR